MSYSLNEYEALCKKAARGSGMHWGQSEEVGKAARFLGTYGLDDGRLVLRAIKTFGPRNALWLGPALCDEGWDFEEPLVIRGIEAQALMLPFLHMMVPNRNVSLCITWDRFDAIVSSAGIYCILCDGLYEDGALDISISKTSRSKNEVLCAQSRVDIPKDILDRLNSLAFKTYAPATEESRLKGAGAGFSDNN